MQDFLLRHVECKVLHIFSPPFALAGAFAPPWPCFRHSQLHIFLPFLSGNPRRCNAWGFLFLQDNSCRNSCQTTTATTLAYDLAQLDGPVLLIDADQQGNASQIMGAYDPTAWGVEKLLEPDADAASVDDLKQTREWKPKKKAPAVRVDVVAASAALMDANMDVAADTVNDQVHRLQERLAAVSDAYKYAVIDCGLLLDMAVLNALVAADLWIVPVKPGGFEVDGLLRVHEQLEELRQLNDGLELWVLPVMFGKSNTHKAVMAHLRTLGHRVTLATIRRSVIAESYTAAALPLPVYSPRCGVAKDYEALAYEVMAWNDESEVKA